MVTMLRRKSVIEFLEPRTLFTTAFTVALNDPTNTYLPYHDEIQSTLVSAANEWATKISGAGTIDLEVDFSSTVPTAQTASTVSVPVAMTAGGTEIDEQGVTHEIRTGVDPNGAAPDAMMTIGANYLTNDLWFDPDPLLRNTADADPIPDGKVDAYSVFLHELVHAFAFNGNRDTTGVLPASADNVETTFDQYVAADNHGNLFFTGPHAKAIYGGNVPLTFNDAFHVGNAVAAGNDPQRPGANIRDDLMNGVGFLRGHRYNVSALDLAMLTDTGVPIIGTLPTLTVADVSHAEGDSGATPFVFNVSLTSPTTNPVSVDYSTAPGSATTNSDFMQTHGTLMIPSGQTSGAITVPVIGDTLVESDESFSLALSNPIGTTLGTTVAIGTITNDDFAISRTITFSSHAPARYADSSGKTVTVSLKGAGSGTITFNSTSADADTISLSGTTARSMLLIKARSTTVRKITDAAVIGTIDARSVALTSTLSAPVMSSLSLGNIIAANLALTGSTALIFSAAAITNAAITAGGFKSFSAGAISGSSIGVTTGITTLSASSIDSSTIFVAAATAPVTLPAAGAAFSKRNASIKTLTVKGPFSSTVITAPTLGTVKLGRVSVSNNARSFGLAAHSIASVTAITPAMPHLKLSKLTSPVKNYAESDFAITVI
jgi:hypothetical protein